MTDPRLTDHRLTARRLTAVAAGGGSVSKRLWVDLEGRRV